MQVTCCVCLYLFREQTNSCQQIPFNRYYNKTIPFEYYVKMSQVDEIIFFFSFSLLSNILECSYCTIAMKLLLFGCATQHETKRV